MAAPTRRQLALLKALADRTGTTFAYPKTRNDASCEIDRLRSAAPATAAARRARGVSPDRDHYATAPRTDEITGFGSSATWRNRGRS